MSCHFLALLRILSSQSRIVGSHTSFEELFSSAKPRQYRPAKPSVFSPYQIASLSSSALPDELYISVLPT